MFLFKKNKNPDIKSPHLTLNFCKQILNTQTILNIRFHL
jgi:hypothetical protein